MPPTARPTSPTAAPGRPRRVVLVGAGHAHLEVLHRLARRPLAGVAVVLVSRAAAAAYSGMLPGVVAGHYAPGDLLIPVGPIAGRAGAEWRRGEAVALDPTARLLGLADGGSLAYDLLSLDVGSAPALAAAPPLGDRLLPVRPVEAFLPALAAAEARHLAGPAPRLAVVGGGAAGVEIALALRHRYDRAGRRVAIALLERGPAIVPGLAAAARRRLVAACTAHVVEIRTDTETAEGFDLVVWAAGAAAPAWLAGTGLALDAAGYVLVDRSLRSVSHPEVFAVGDVAALAADPRPKAGVFAVRQGPVLAENLRRAVAGRAPLAYRPQRVWLSLVATGPRHAIAARGRLAVSGRWVWWWKDRIDRRYVARHRPGAAEA